MSDRDWGGRRGRLWVARGKSSRWRGRWIRLTNTVWVVTTVAPHWMPPPSTMATMEKFSAGTATPQTSVTRPSPSIRAGWTARPSWGRLAMLTPAPGVRGKSSKLKNVRPRLDISIATVSLVSSAQRSWTVSLAAKALMERFIAKECGQKYQI